MTRSEPFPWPEPEDRPLPIMSSDAGPSYESDADVLQWFLDARASKAIGGSAPIHRWMIALREATGRRLVVESESEERRHAVVVAAVPNSESLVPGTHATPGGLVAACDLYAARLAAHSIRGLESRHIRGTPTLRVDANFVGAELGARDRSLPGGSLPELAAPAFPAGLGTLLAASALSRAGGSTLRIFGSSSKSLDVEWVGHDGSIVRVEAKTRAFADAFSVDASPEKLRRWLVPELVKKGRDLRRRTKQDGAAALQIVHFAAFVPLPIARALQRIRWGDELMREYRHVREWDRPHVVIVNWLGIDVVDMHVVGESRPEFAELRSAKPRPSEGAFKAYAAMAYRPSDLPPPAPLRR